METAMIHPLREAIGALTIIDTHEHLTPYEQNRTKNDILQEYLTHYFVCDLRSAGLTQAALDMALDGRRPLEERFAILKPYWEVSRYTGYGRALDIAAKGIYGIDGVRAETIEALNDAFFALRKTGGHYHRVLKELSRIETSVLDGWCDDADGDFFQLAFNVGSYVMPNDAVWMRKRGEELGIHVHTLSDWLDVTEQSIRKALKEQTICLKSSLAYRRSIHFPKTTFAQAEADFADRGEAFQNYVMHHILRVAGELRLPMQVHTGLLEGNGNKLANSHPLLLTNLFLEYPEVNFDLFHISYPYMLEAGALSKNFPNVFLDMCWAHIISPTASINALEEWLDAVPYNKISAFGGDYCLVDGVYGHQELARDNVATALSRKVRAGVFSEDTALSIAEHLFYKNPKRILCVRG